MWTDNETNRDFLNFKLVADTAAEMVIQAKGKPLSLGISGRWGIGKSSMIRLIEESLQEKNADQFIFVHFNPWLYQGYDDAKSALMETIARELVKHAKENSPALEQAKSLLNRIDWFRLAKLTGSGIALAHGIPLGVFGEVSSLMHLLNSKTVTGADCAKAEEIGKDVLKIIKDKPQYSPPKEIQDLRNHFEETLKTMKSTLVVFIDDLDRCLPDTTISTLEAIRLFLFLENTAFIIAADDAMLRNAVKVHFGNMDIKDTDEIVTNYFDKLVQIPIHVPPLGTQEVRAYIMLLFIDNSDLDESAKETLRVAICRQLSEAWQNKRVDSTFVAALISKDRTKLLEQIDMADRLAPFMVSSHILGNPRLIKRFLNTLSLRLSIAKNQGVPVDESILIKMMLLERCGGDAAYAQLISEINNSADGRPSFLKRYEEQVVSGEIKEAPSGWEPNFASKWLALSPSLADKDLRPAVHVSRESIPVITPADQLSAQGAELLIALRSMTTSNSSFKERLILLNKAELHYIANCLLSDAKVIVQWSKPPILAALMAVAEADKTQEKRVVDFLSKIDVRHLKPAVVAYISPASWSCDVFNVWKASDELPSLIKNAIDEIRPR